MDEPNIILTTLSEVAKNPGKLLFGAWEFFLSWMGTRHWLAMLFLLIPGGTLLTMLSLSTYGQFRGSIAISEAYLEEVNAEELGENAKGDNQQEPDSDGQASANSLFEQESVSPRSEMMLRRILQLDTSNRSATYLVATQLAKRGRIGQARLMMRKIAAKGARGFPPSHAWLASEQISNNQIISPEDKQALLNDLEIASEWQAVSPLLMSVYADLLVSEKRVNAAMKVLEQPAKRDERLWLKLANIAKVAGRDDAFENALTRIREKHQPDIDSHTAQADQYAAVAQAALLEENIELAIQLANAGLRKSSNDLLLRRIMSEAYVIQYRKTSDVTKGRFSLELLDAAMKADSSNPAVTEEVAKLQSLGENVTPELVALLEEKLTSGKASALTHLLLANQYLTKSEFSQAIGHLEIAVRLSPNSMIALNNLAISLSRKFPDSQEKLERAEQLMVRAIQVSGTDPELLDTLGEIRMTAGKDIDAIQCFEAAINQAPNRVRTRQKLAAAYRKIGLDDMAELQEKYINTLNEQPPVSPSDTPDQDDSDRPASSGENSQI